MSGQYNQGQQQQQAPHQGQNPDEEAWPSQQQWAEDAYRKRQEKRLARQSLAAAGAAALGARPSPQGPRPMAPAFTAASAGVRPSISQGLRPTALPFLPTPAAPELPAAPAPAPTMPAPTTPPPPPTGPAATAPLVPMIPEGARWADLSPSPPRRKSEEVRQLEQRVDRLLNKIDRLEASVKAEEENVAEAHSYIERLEEEKKELVARNGNLASDLAEKDRQIKGMDDEIERLKSRDEELTEKLRLAEITRQESLKEKTDTEASIRSLVDDNVAAADRSEVLQDSVARLVSQYHFLQDQNRDLDSKVQSHEKHRRAILETEEAQQGLNREIDQLNEEIIDLSQKCLEHEQKIAEQQQELNDLRPQPLQGSPATPSSRARPSHGSTGSTAGLLNLQDELPEEDALEEVEMRDSGVQTDAIEEVGDLFRDPEVEVNSEEAEDVLLVEEEEESEDGSEWETFLDPPEEVVEEMEEVVEETASAGAMAIIDMPKPTQTGEESVFGALYNWYQGTTLQQQFMVWLLLGLYLYWTIDFLASYLEQAAWIEANDLSFLNSPSAPFSLLRAIGGASIVNIGVKFEESLGVVRTRFG